GGYGPMTIDKAISVISPDGVYAGITASGGTGITINTAPGDIVMLRGLTINGGSGGSTGIQINAGAVVEIDKVTISGFVDGITASDAQRVHVYDSFIRNSAGTGMYIGAGNGPSFLLIDHCRLEGNVNGIFVSGLNSVIRRSQIVGTHTGTGIAS